MQATEYARLKSPQATTHLVLDETPIETNPTKLNQQPPPQSHCPPCIGPSSRGNRRPHLAGTESRHGQKPHLPADTLRLPIHGLSRQDQGAARPWERRRNHASRKRSIATGYESEVIWWCWRTDLWLSERRGSTAARLAAATRRRGRRACPR